MWTKNPRQADGPRNKPGTDRRAASRSTQNQALNAVVFLYRKVIKKELEDFSDFERARMPKRLPVVLSRQEVDKVLRRMDGIEGLIARLKRSGLMALCHSAESDGGEFGKGPDSFFATLTQSRMIPSYAEQRKEPCFGADRLTAADRPAGAGGFAGVAATGAGSR